MADFDIGESLPTEDSQLHAVMTSQRDINSIKTVGGEDVHSSEDGEKSVAENNDEERNRLYTELWKMGRTLQVQLIELK